MLRGLFIQKAQHVADVEKSLTPVRASPAQIRNAHLAMCFAALAQKRVKLRVFQSGDTANFSVDGNRNVPIRILCGLRGLRYLDLYCLTHLAPTVARDFLVE